MATCNNSAGASPRCQASVPLVRLPRHPERRLGLVALPATPPFGPVAVVGAGGGVRVVRPGGLIGMW